jgi:hypothetical protein
MQLGAIMRLLRILLLVQVMSIVANGQAHSSLIGKTQDCFAGRTIHPAQVDVYLLDPLKSPEVATILKDMEKQMPRGNDQNVDAFFASYQRLTSAIRKTNILMQAQSNEAGSFSFQGLKAGSELILLGIAEREDEPAYYAYMPLKLKPGKNSVALDFDRGVACKSP